MREYIFGEIRNYYSVSVLYRLGYMYRHTQAFNQILLELLITR